jgi:hypothetical protein
MCVTGVLMSGHWIPCGNKRVVLFVNTATVYSVHLADEWESGALFVACQYAHANCVTNIWVTAITAGRSTVMIASPAYNRALSVTKLCVPLARLAAIAVARVSPNDAKVISIQVGTRNEPGATGTRKCYIYRCQQPHWRYTLAGKKWLIKWANSTQQRHGSPRGHSTCMFK